MSNFNILFVIIMFHTATKCSLVVKINYKKAFDLQPIGLLPVNHFIVKSQDIYHSGWTPFYFMYDPKCSTTFPWCTINAPAAFAWCTINVPAAIARCTNRFVHKVEFSYIGWNGVHPLCICTCEIRRQGWDEMFWVANHHDLNYWVPFPDFVKHKPLHHFWRTISGLH